MKQLPVHTPTVTETLLLAALFALLAPVYRVSPFGGWHIGGIIPGNAEADILLSLIFELPVVVIYFILFSLVFIPLGRLRTNRILFLLAVVATGILFTAVNRLTLPYIFPNLHKKIIENRLR